MPGWKGSNRRQTLPPGWGKTTLRILNRDHHLCQHIREDTGRRCGKYANQVDHILRPDEGGTDDDSNLQSLCEWHHQRKSSREGGVASGKSRRAKRDDAKPLHPGLIDRRDQHGRDTRADQRTLPDRRHEPPPF